MGELKEEFFVKHLEEGFKKIVEAQSDIAFYRRYRQGPGGRIFQGSGKRLHDRSGRLGDWLADPSYTVKASGGGVRGIMRNFPIYMRFLDMKEHGNFMIYNRQIWGILYGDTFNRMRYEFREYIAERLKEIFFDVPRKPGKQ